jgi:DNA-binding CsgD family transcriptional regulator
MIAHTDDPTPAVGAVQPARDTLARRLALAKVRDLRAAGLSYHEIARRFGGAGPDGPPSGPVTEVEPMRPAVRRVNSDAAALLSALDAVDQPLAFFDCGGALVHANRRVLRVLEACRDAAGLRAEIEHFAVSLCGVVRLRRLNGHTLAEEIAAREVPSGEEHYRLRGSYVGLDLFERGGSVLVAVERPAPTLLEADALRERFGLSKQESRIAHLLARGKSNVQIAEALFISPHTARTHTQRVLEKLGARSRAEVATRIHAPSRE